MLLSGLVSVETFPPQCGYRSSQYPNVAVPLCMPEDRADGREKERHIKKSQSHKIRYATYMT